jgi:hypothetical protein
MVPFQISEFNDEFLDDLKRIDVVEKPLEDENIACASTSSCDKQYGSQDDDDVGTLFVISGHRWDVDHWFLHGDPIYDTDSESLIEENLNWHSPHPISIGSHFMEHEENISNPILFNFGQPKDVEVMHFVLLINI